MLTMKGKYGLKAVLYLAGQSGRGPIAIAEVAAAEQIPQKFLEAILLDLKRQGILHSRMGQRGGYQLARTPEEITVGQVLRCLDGPLALVPCVSQTAYARCEECVDEAACGIRVAMKQVRDATAAILDQTSLSALNQQSRAAARHVAPDRERHRRWRRSGAQQSVGRHLRPPAPRGSLVLQRHRLELLLQRGRTLLAG